MGDRGWDMGKGFKELIVWQKARDLAVDLYKITEKDFTVMIICDI